MRVINLLLVIVALVCVASANQLGDTVAINAEQMESDSLVPKVRVARWNHYDYYDDGNAPGIVSAEPYEPYIPTLSAKRIRSICESYRSSYGGGQGRGHINNYGGSEWGGHGRRK